MGVQERLTRTVLSAMALALLAGCAAESEADPTLAGMCEGKPSPDDHFLATGYVEVSPGTECPSIEDAELLINECTFFKWKGITCALEEIAYDQVFIDDGDGGYHEDASTTTGTGTTPGQTLMDVCYYEGVFYRNPEHPTCLGPDR